MVYTTDNPWFSLPKPVQTGQKKTGSHDPWHPPWTASGEHHGWSVVFLPWKPPTVIDPAKVQIAPARMNLLEEGSKIIQMINTPIVLPREIGWEVRSSNATP